jgi:hypothetical protein
VLLGEGGLGIRDAIKAAREVEWFQADALFRAATGNYA